MSRAQLLALLFVAASLVELGAEVAGAPGLIFVSKATLLPLLGATWLAAVPLPRARIDRRMTVAFAASWVGDVCLMLAPAHPGDAAVLGLPKHDLWFVAGIGAFFVAHLAFIAVFREVDRPEVPGPFPARAAWLLPLVAYGLTLLGIVLPRLAADPVRSIAAAPVALYACILCAMVGFAAGRHGRVASASFWPTLVGAIVFLLSDSMIAVEHLARIHIPGSHVWIMATYLAAEVLIAWGIAVQRGARWT